MREAKVTRAFLLKLCCEEFGCSLKDIRKGKRFHNISKARMVYAYLIRKHLKDTVARIAIELECNHTSVIYMLRKVEDYEFIKDPIVKTIHFIEEKLF